jgi:hypothetical protein
MIYLVLLHRTTSNLNLWNLISSVGPITSSADIAAWNVVPISTTGGALNLYTSSVQTTFQATYVGTPPSPPTPTLTRSGVLSHIAAGSEWTTVITLVNNSSAAVPVTIALHSDSGTALTLPVTTTQQGKSITSTTSSVSATINPKATLLLSMGGSGSTVVGFADVLSSGPLGGFAIFRDTMPNGSTSEGTVPLQSQFPSSTSLAYDDTTGFVMGVALANLSTSPAMVTATIWDDSGNQLGTQYLTIPGNGHMSFVLPNQFAQTAERRGIIQFQSSGGLAGLGLRFSPIGTFTSVPTM